MFWSKTYILISKRYKIDPGLKICHIKSWLKIYYWLIDLSLLCNYKNLGQKCFWGVLVAKYSRKYAIFINFGKYEVISSTNCWQQGVENREKYVKRVKKLQMGEGHKSVLLFPWRAAAGKSHPSPQEELKKF